MVSPPNGRRSLLFVGNTEVLSCSDVTEIPDFLFIFPRTGGLGYTSGLVGANSLDAAGEMSTGDRN